MAGCPAGGIVLDPFVGSGTTAVVATRLGRRFVEIELNAEYVAMARARVAKIEPAGGGEGGADSAIGRV